MKAAFNYEDILDLPHPISKNHPAMPLLARAAQFAAFKALTGYEEEIAEEGRYTEQAVELDEHRKEVLDRRLRILWERRREEPTAEFICFEPDQRKTGGSYRHIFGVLVKIDPMKNMLLLQSGEQIAIESLCDMQSDLFWDE